MADDVAIIEGGGTAEFEFAFAEQACAGFALRSRASSQKGLLLTSRLPPETEVPT